MKFAEGDKVVTDSIDIVTKSVVKYMIKSGRKLCTAESCTGGMISQTITSVSGASEMFLGGACTYTEEIKMKLLNVKKETLEQYTVYSEQTASEMSKGALKLFGADCAYVSGRRRHKEIVRRLELYKEYENLDRRKIRMLTTETALRMVLELYEQKAEA